MSWPVMNQHVGEKSPSFISTSWVEHERTVSWCWRQLWRRDITLVLTQNDVCDEDYQLNTHTDRHTVTDIRTVTDIQITSWTQTQRQSHIQAHSHRHTNYQLNTDTATVTHTSTQSQTYKLPAEHRHSDSHTYKHTVTDIQITSWTQTQWCASSDIQITVSATGVLWLLDHVCETRC